MNRFLPFLLVALALVSTAHAQFGYVAQTPAAGAGMPPVGMMDPNMGMASAGMAYGAPAAPYAQGAMGMMTPGAASQMLSYGLLEGQYVLNTFKDKSLDSSSGVKLELTAQLFNPFFLHADFSWSSNSGSKQSGRAYDFSTIRVGGGGFFAITDRIHLVAEVGGLYSTLTAKKDALSFSDGALYINPTLRFAATDALELQAGVMMTSADKYNTRVIELGGYFKLFSQMDLGAGIDFGNLGSSYHAGVRFRW
jgi:hypothetical protein